MKFEMKSQNLSGEMKAKHKKNEIRFHNSPKPYFRLKIAFQAPSDPLLVKRPPKSPTFENKFTFDLLNYQVETPSIILRTKYCMFDKS